MGNDLSCCVEDAAQPDPSLTAKLPIWLNVCERAVVVMWPVFDISSSNAIFIKASVVRYRVHVDVVCEVS